MKTERRETGVGAVLIKPTTDYNERHDGYRIEHEDEEVSAAVVVRFLDPLTARSSELRDGCKVSTWYGGLRSSEDARRLAALLTIAAELAESEDAKYADLIAAAEERERKEQEEAARKHEERQALLAERKETLMVELLGAEVKVRLRGYKSMPRAVVEVIDRNRWYDYDRREYVSTEGEEDWQPRIRWTDDCSRDARLGLIVRLDVKTTRGWATVWDDGTDDLSSFDSDLKGGSRPTGLRFGRDGASEPVL